MAVTGATGLIGTALLPALVAAGHEVQRITRGSRDARPGDIRWDPDSGVLNASDLGGVDVVIHLAGENVAQRWTAESQRRILESRTRGTRLLAETVARVDRKPATLISASAIGYYGVAADSPVDEHGAAGTDFLADVVRQWEASAEPARIAGIRVVHPRIGIVLSPEGGALQRLLPPFKAGVGGRLGNGKQWMSWISMRDLIRGFQHLIRDARLSGPVNMVAPAPVQNSEFAKTLARTLHRPAFFPVPAAALQLAFGEMAQGTILASQRVVPRALLDSGFTFEHPSLELALRHELST